MYCPSCGKPTEGEDTKDGTRCTICMNVRRLDKYSKATKLVIFLKEHYGFNSAQIRYICTKKLGMTSSSIHNKIDIYVKRWEIEDAELNFRARRIKKILREEELI